MSKVGGPARQTGRRLSQKTTTARPVARRAVATADAMSKAIAVFAGGITDLRQIAVRADGTVFSRWQEWHPSYGYHWQPWRTTGEMLSPDALANIHEYLGLRRASPDDSSLNTRSLFNDKGEISVKLPDA